MQRHCLLTGCIQAENAMQKTAVSMLTCSIEICRICGAREKNCMGLQTAQLCTTRESDLMPSVLQMQWIHTGRQAGLAIICMHTWRSVLPTVKGAIGLDRPTGIPIQKAHPSAYNSCAHGQRALGKCGPRFFFLGPLRRQLTLDKQDRNSSKISQHANLCKDMQSRAMTPRRCEQAIHGRVANSSQLVAPESNCLMSNRPIAQCSISKRYPPERGSCRCELALLLGLTGSLLSPYHPLTM